VIDYPAILDVPEELVTHLAGLLDLERGRARHQDRCPQAQL
jgi:hypothetical protein